MAHSIGNRKTLIRLLRCLTLAVVTPCWPQFMVDTVAGGKIFSGVPAQSALLTVSGITQDSAGNIYVCDGAWGVIRRIRTSGIIETIAGTGITGYSGDGGPAISADLGGPSACKMDAAGNLFFVDGVTRVRRMDTPGVITTVAGTGIDGTFDQDAAFGRTVGDAGPATMAQIEVYDLVLDHDGNIYFF